MPLSKVLGNQSCSVSSNLSKGHLRSATAQGRRAAVAGHRLACACLHAMNLQSAGLYPAGCRQLSVTGRRRLHRHREWRRRRRELLNGAEPPMERTPGIAAGRREGSARVRPALRAEGGLVLTRTLPVTTRCSQPRFALTTRSADDPARFDAAGRMMDSVEARGVPESGGEFS